MNDMKLPDGWKSSAIGNLCDLFNGRAFKQTEWQETGLPIIRIQNLNNPRTSYNYYKGHLDAKHFVKNGDLLFAWSGTPGTSFGTHEWKGGDAALNQHIFKINFSEENIDKSFFRYAIDQKLEYLISSANGGVGLRHVTKGTFEKTEISFPPLAEQKVIADKLDTLLAQVESTKARLEHIPDILKRFRQSVLAAAVSGRLTDKWRAQNGFQIKEWKSTTFSKICREITVGYVGKMSDQYKDSGIPFLRSQNVRAFQFSPDNLLYISEDFHIKIYKSRLESSDLAIVRSGAPGTTCVIPDDLGIANCSDLVIARPSEDLVSEFGCIFMNSEVAQKNVSENRVGVAQQHFNVGSMKKMPINLPSTEEQTEIVRRVEQLFAHADKIEQQTQAALDRVNNITQSILAKAFRGELTADWRAAHPELISGENSAEALLAKIKAEREAMQPTKKTRTIKAAV